LHSLQAALSNAGRALLFRTEPSDEIVLPREGSLDLDLGEEVGLPCIRKSERVFLQLDVFLSTSQYW
jgi:hypothetical protein